MAWLGQGPQAWRGIPTPALVGVRQQIRLRKTSRLRCLRSGLCLYLDFGLDALDGDQHKAKIAHSVQHTMQGGLIRE